MAPSRSKYKRLPDLYVAGAEHVLVDGTVVWLQVLNPLERDEAQHDAHVSRARLVMALKGDTGSDERAKVEAAFLEDGPDAAVDRLVESKLASNLWKTMESIQNEKDWREKIEILDRSDDLLSRPVEDAERQLLEQINTEYFAELQRRQDDERDFLVRRYGAMTQKELAEEFIDLYLEKRGNEVAQAEYMLTELWFGARCCDGTQNEAGEWDHSTCEQHGLQVYETKTEVRALPEALQNDLTAVMALLNMSVREAKNSDRQGSSSGSSPLPSVPEASTPSIPTEIPAELPGTSSPPSVTPLAS